MRSRRPLTLKAKAIDYLSRREHSRLELARKLTRYAPDAEEAEIEAVLTLLESQGLLSNERFTQSLVHRRSAGLGTARVLQELRQHGVDAGHLAEVRTALEMTEFERAQAVWRKRFGQSAADPAERARQQRFLAQRGFGFDVIRKVTSADYTEE